MPRRRPPFLRSPVLVGLALLLGANTAACSDDSHAASRSTTSHSTTSAASATTFPGTEWVTTTAADAGLDQKVLDELARTAEASDSNCLLVTRGGKLVREWYWNGTGPDTPQEVWSASKSFTSTFIGMASDDGKVKVTDLASKYIPQWKGTPSDSVTVENLLSNDSGRHFDTATDYGKMAAQAPDKTGFAIALGQDAPPGKVWVYNNSAIQTLEAVFQAATGKDMSEVADKRLFEPTGMAHSSLKRDAAGNPLAFMGIQSTCRDMARYGWLMANQGNWDGKQVVSADWVKRATKPSQDLNAAYGWLWWVNGYGPQEGAEQSVGGGTASTPGPPGRLVDGAPDDIFFAQGLGGQIIAIDPATETVVVRLGPPTYPEGTPKFRSKDAAKVAIDAAG